MNKNDLITALAATTKLSKTEATIALDSLLETITTALRKKERVSLVGFGTFSVSRRRGGEGRNPRTGETIKIPPSNVPRFKAGKGLKDAIN